MIQTYLKTTFRNLVKNRKHALLNILGLSVALAACIIVFLVIQYETGYDKHLKNYKNIHQIVTKDVDAAGEHYTAGVPFPLIKYLRQDYPQYTFTEMMQNNGVQVTVKQNSAESNNKKFREETGLFYGEPELMQMFEVNFLTGNASLLKDVNSVALSKSIAEKYFGSWKEAAGKRINIDNSNYDLQVAAVFDDVPENSDFPFKIVASYAGFIAHDGNGWPLTDWGSNTSNHQVYVLLPEKANIPALDKELHSFERKYDKNKKSTRTHFLQPLSKIHFDDKLSNNGDHITTRRSLYTLAFVGLLVILMACINFVNLSTALAVTRSKEVGIRKVMGSSKTQLRTQVFFETGMLVITAAVIASGLSYIALPYVKNIFAAQGTLSLFNTGSIVFILLITLVTILLSGIYPAFIMGKFKPVEAIKSKINTTKVGSISLRRALVVLQFSFSQIFIIATIIAVSQMNFIRTADLGFNKESVLMLQMNSDSITHSRIKVFKEELLSRSDVKLVSFGLDAPSSGNSWQSNFAFDKMEDKDFSVSLKMGDENYANTYGLKLLAGRFYEASDTCREYVVNETLLKKCGMKNPQDAIGKLFRLGGREPMPVVGVVKDFKQQSLKEAVVPIVISPKLKYYQSAGIKLFSNNLLKSNTEIQQLWDKYFPEYVYNSNFLDDSINRYYEQEQRLSLMYKIYAALAIFISCLGLYGLVSFMVVQKTKEVGIRKVLGASVQSIMYLFSKEFTVLIAIAFLLAAPAAWYLMNSWLKDFVYRINIGVGVFAVAIAASILIAWVTVGYKSLRAALANPVQSLRME
ncbi:MAG: ABC transporter permease [Sphingobacteriales bacterium]|nr:ABC transporter permease [Sphingobacteriales bacterium]